MLWGTIKSFLDPETASKIHVWLLLFIDTVLSYYSCVVFGLYILILTNLFHIKVLGNKYQTKLLEIIDGRLGSQILLTVFLFGFHPNVFQFHFSVNSQNFLVASAGVKSMEVVRNQIKALGRILKLSRYFPSAVLIILTSCPVL
jgi:hypothetical protein